MPEIFMKMVLHVLCKSEKHLSSLINICSCDQSYSVNSKRAPQCEDRLIVLVVTVPTIPMGILSS